MVHKTLVLLLCLALCLTGIGVPSASAAVLATSVRASLTLCLQRVYLMRDVYQDIAARFPSLATFASIGDDETAMIATITRIFAKYQLAVPSDTMRPAAEAIAATATSSRVADTVAIDLEMSTGMAMTRLLQTTRSVDAARVAELIRTTSLGSHASAFTLERAAIAEAQTAQTSPRPFPPPVTTRTVHVPTSIDATGTTDASPALNAFVASVPDGSVIEFHPGTIYRLDQGIQVANRHSLVFSGNGTTLKVGSHAGANDQLASPFVLGHQYGKWWQGGNTDIVIHDFVLIGNDPTPGTFTAGQEAQANIEITGSDRVEIYSVTGSAAPGDFVFVNGVNGAWIHDCEAPTVGRTGGTIISGRDITFERNTFGVVGYCVFNIEPNCAAEATHNAQFVANTAVSWDCAFLSVEGSHTGAVIDGVIADSNTVTGDSIRTVIDNGGTARMRNVTFINNIGKKADDGPVLVFAHIDGLSVSGNVQPLSSGPLMKIVNSTEGK